MLFILGRDKLTFSRAMQLSGPTKLLAPVFFNNGRTRARILSAASCAVANNETTHQQSSLKSVSLHHRAYITHTFRGQFGPKRGPILPNAMSILFGS
mmetsp:Transcript_5860/g.22236  ORF Transcript_5860/g.22236 Transcript_5860/m.22236 type:complete len:97 (-) Transcript_5860:570-860(-)